MTSLSEGREERGSWRYLSRQARGCGTSRAEGDDVRRALGSCSRLVFEITPGIRVLAPGS